ncbi:MAG: hypothetical protein AB7O66_18180 [Limisphaerales bacterium]
MKVMGHQAKRESFIPGFLAGLPQGLEGILPVDVVLKDGLPRIAPVRDTFDRTRDVRSRPSLDGSSFPMPPDSVKTMVWPLVGNRDITEEDHVQAIDWTETVDRRQQISYKNLAG